MDNQNDMTNDDNDLRFEKRMFQIFDPNNVSQWLQYSPLDFIGIMLLEIHQQNEAIQAWSELMAKIPEFNTQIYQLNNQEITAKFFLDVNLASSRIIDRLLDTMRAYTVEMSKTDKKNQ
jgi:hypothetical protein